MESKEKQSFVEIIGEVLEKEISLGAKIKFCNHRELAGIEEYPPHVQRIVINRVLTTELLKWRSKNNTPVYQCIGYLHNDGEATEWISHFMYYILPFLKHKNILGE